MQTLPGGSAHEPTLSLETAARHAVSVLAPEELEFFAEVTASWARRRLPYQCGSRRMAGGTIGIGVDVSLLTELIYAAISGAAAELLGAAATDAWQRRRWWRRAPKENNDQVREILLAGGDAERLRAACRRHGVALGLTDGQADLLADAVYGAVQQPEKPS